ncbi:MAG: diguanylate cyclase domain-containing protein, partial [Gammaproteobacteria bacterium]
MPAPTRRSPTPRPIACTTATAPWSGCATTRWRWSRPTAPCAGTACSSTREKDLEERLGHQAFHDSLTGLPNRVMFGDQVARALEEGGDVAVLFVDLDRFKNINDSFGHTYGDKVLVAAARRIKGCVRRRDVAARLGGDEFAVLVRGGRPERLTELADRILEKLRGTP